MLYQKFVHQDQAIISVSFVLYSMLRVGYAALPATTSRYRIPEVIVLPQTRTCSGRLYFKEKLACIAVNLYASSSMHGSAVLTFVFTYMHPFVSCTLCIK